MKRFLRLPTLLVPLLVISLSACRTKSSSRDVSQPGQNFNRC